MQSTESPKLDSETATYLAKLLNGERHTPAVAKRLKGLMLLASGAPPTVVSRRLDVSLSTVTYWRKQFALLGFEFLKDGRVERNGSTSKT